MNDSTPHYLLLAEAGRTGAIGRWRFELRPVDGSTSIEVSDLEPDIWGERLNLLTVVRGLEALDQPSRVTLIGCTRYVEQGIQFGLSDWRESDWRWEYFGQMVPIRDADLWQRMDRILEIHQVHCNQRRIDAAHHQVSDPHWDATKSGTSWVDRVAGSNWLKYSIPAMVAWWASWVELASRSWQFGVRHLGGCFSSYLLHRS